MKKTSLLPLFLFVGGLYAYASNKKSVVSGIGSVASLEINDHSWDGKSVKELKTLAKQHFSEHLQGKKVYNRHKGIEVILANTGLKHSINNKYLVIEDFLAGKNIDIIIQSALFKHSGKPKREKVNEIGYYNFKSNLVINGKNIEVKISVRLIKEGSRSIQRFYYDHYTIKEKS